MVVVMHEGATEDQVQNVIDRLIQIGFDVHRSTGASHTVLGAVGGAQVDPRDVELLDGVREVVKISASYKLASRAFKPDGTIVKVGPPGKQINVGGRDVVIMAGPCTVESQEQISTIAGIMKECGVRVLRGGAFKPRTSPYSFQGMGEDGLKVLRHAGDQYGLLVVSEIMNQTQIPMFLELVDILQVGARNMQNFDLLKELGKVHKPVLLKRGPSATIEEWLLSAEYIMTGGNHDVILCERGIRTFESYTRNTLDISAIPVIQKLSHLPILADPSHGTGRRDKVPPMARAAVAAGCDGAQSLYPAQFRELISQLKMIAPAVQRSMM